MTDEQAGICSDVLPTGYFAAQLAEVTPGDAWFGPAGARSTSGNVRPEGALSRAPKR